MLTAGLMTLSMGTAVFADEANEKERQEKMENYMKGQI